MCTRSTTKVSIWILFCNFVDERLAEEDLGEIPDEDEVTRIKTTPTILPMLQIEPANSENVETEEEAKRSKCHALADISWTGSRNLRRSSTAPVYWCSSTLISYPVQVKEGPSFLMNNTISCTRIVVHLMN